MHIYFLVSFLFSFLLTSNQSKAAEACIELFPNTASYLPAHPLLPEVIDVSLQIRKISMGEEPEARNQLFNSLLSNSFEFNQFVQSRIPETERRHLTAEQSQAILLEYLQQKWKGYLDAEQLTSLQNRAIDRELDARQVPKGSQTGWSRLKKLSRNNFQRAVKKNRLLPLESYDPKIVALVQKLQFNIYRNTKIPMTLGQGVLSSRQIQEIAGVRGKNSMFAFNFDFLKGDDSIFFYVDVKLNSSTSEAAVRSDFGEYNKTLTPENLPSHGWVAPYIMYFAEMVEIHKNLPEILGPTKVIEEGQSTKDRYIPTASEIQAASSLTQFYFTSQDFHHLLKMAYAQMITAYLNDHPGVTLAQAAEAAIEPIYSSQLKPLLRKLGFPEAMEYKVPVFVDRQHFSENNGHN